MRKPFIWIRIIEEYYANIYHYNAKITNIATETIILNIIDYKSMYYID